jgi:hypothetical protein
MSLEESNKKHLKSVQSNLINVEKNVSNHRGNKVNPIDLAEASTEEIRKQFN